MENFYDLIPKAELEIKESALSKHISVPVIQKYFKDKEYRQAEDVIFQALYFHQYLTKQNIIRFANRKLNEENKDGFYENILKKLHKDGCIHICSYGKITLYTLSDTVREFLTDKYKNIKNRFFLITKKDAASVLECASLAQWHISLFCGEKVRKGYFYEKSHVGNLEINFPSYLEFIKGEYTYHVISNVIPKSMPATEDFFCNIKTISHAFRTSLKIRKNHIFLNIILVPDIESIKRIAKILSSIPIAKEITFYFAIEEQTIATKGLSLLYTYEDTGRDIVIATIKFKE